MAIACCVSRLGSKFTKLGYLRNKEFNFSANPVWVWIPACTFSNVPSFSNCRVITCGHWLANLCLAPWTFWSPHLFSSRNPRPRTRGLELVPSSRTFGLIPITTWNHPSFYPSTWHVRNDPSSFENPVTSSVGPWFSQGFPMVFLHVLNESTASDWAKHRHWAWRHPNSMSHAASSELGRVWINVNWGPKQQMGLRSEN